MAATREELATLYLAFHGRAPDSSGYWYWTGVSSSGVSYETLCNIFLDVVETGNQNLRTLTAAEYVVVLYQRLFNRVTTVSDPGVIFWANKITANELNYATAMPAIAYDASGADMAALVNKITAALKYVDAGLNGTDYTLEEITDDKITVISALSSFIDNNPDTDEPVISTVDTTPSACNVSLPNSSTTNVSPELDVEEKFRILVEEALSSGSIYMRAKDTFKELLDSANLDGREYAIQASQFISQLAVSTTNTAMATAIQWAQMERDGRFSMEMLKAQAELVMAEKEKMRYDICATKEQIALQKAQFKAAMAASIRDNGRIASYEADGITPASLVDEGTKFIQAKSIGAQAYATLADAYRKSGVVNIGNVAGAPWMYYGTSNGTVGDVPAQGLTYWQTLVAERQRTGFDDDYNQKLYKHRLDTWSVAFSSAGTDAGITVPTSITPSVIDGTV